MIRLAALFAVSAFLAGCSERQPVANQIADANLAVPDLAPPPAEAPEMNGTAGAENVAAEGNAAQVEAAPTAAAWTGRFAATPQLCRGGAWDIGRERIVTEGETSCTVEAADETGPAVRLTLACQAEGTRSAETWTLTPGPEGALGVERNTGTETVRVQLRRCG